MAIAILGWGSLLWDLRPEFDGFERQREPWQFDGPSLRLEFSRVSESRKEALTLVLETAPHGAPCTVAYALSKRKALADAVCDLRCREGTTLAKIGVCVTAAPQESRGRLPEVAAAIRTWAAAKGFAAVVWTDLDNNFQKMSRPKTAFSVPQAIAHLQAITDEGKAKAAEYIWRAPAFIQTPLRAALQVAPWFAGVPVVSPAQTAVDALSAAPPAGETGKQADRDSKRPCAPSPP